MRQESSSRKKTDRFILLKLIVNPTLEKSNQNYGEVKIGGHFTFLGLHLDARSRNATQYREKRAAVSMP